MVNRRVLLAARPDGIPTAEHFAIDEVAVPEPADGQVLVRNHWLSVEPAMRGWVSAESNYSAPVPLGTVMRSYASGRVVSSRHPDFQPGDHVTGMLGWQDYAVASPETLRRIDETDLPLSTSLGVLGLNGVTAYFGLREAGRPRPGETVVVSTAAGAVGSCAGQIARIMGCRTVGIAGGPVKTALCLSDFGYDAAIDYKAGHDLDAAIATACPDGIDVYFDNTAGPISDAVLRHLAVGARVVICGTASVSTWTPPPLGPRVERHLLAKRATMQGFLATDWTDRFGEARSAIAFWIREGKLTYKEDILDGLDEAPEAISGLYRGDNLGKRLIRLTDMDSQHQDAARAR
ncbi:alcohol dehydrogenase [Mycolicibacterium goodii]|uniref:Alcohol dehydrogenase n=1 Tax=Mycolicibacterium goodii TaxID=134601 RepID=A0A0K0XHF7_MYCGD|nr:alcohol dehydrogenase [Mycolicibacterium goodii]